MESFLDRIEGDIDRIVRLRKFVIVCLKDGSVIHLKEIKTAKEPYRSRSVPSSKHEADASNLKKCSVVLERMDTATIQALSRPKSVQSAKQNKEVRTNSREYSGEYNSQDVSFVIEENDDDVVILSSSDSNSTIEFSRNSENKNIFINHKIDAKFVKNDVLNEPEGSENIAEIRQKLLETDDVLAQILMHLQNLEEAQRETIQENKDLRAQLIDTQCAMKTQKQHDIQLTKKITKQQVFIDKLVKNVVDHDLIISETESSECEKVS